MSDLKEKAEKQNKIEQMQNLIERLNQAAKAYYQESREIMTNHEYDRLYDMLQSLEKETGVTLSKSPTTRVGYEVLSDLPKEKHPHKMLSLDKTKDVVQLKSWLVGQEGVLSWKLDGLTIVLTYEGGRLTKGVTRGNGEIGEVITANARAFTNLPLTIPFKERLVLRGEAVISYPDFEKINETIADEGAKYKNPRNLCSGSVRQLNSAVTAERHVRFYAFALVSAEGLEFAKRTEQFDWLAEQGFADEGEYRAARRDDAEIGRMQSAVAGHAQRLENLRANASELRGRWSGRERVALDDAAQALEACDARCRGLQAERQRLATRAEVNRHALRRL